MKVTMQQNGKLSSSQLSSLLQICGPARVFFDGIFVSLSYLLEEANVLIWVEVRGNRTHDNKPSMILSFTNQTSYLHITSVVGLKMI
jgi:hypothetical protein